MLLLANFFIAIGVIGFLGCTVGSISVAWLVSYYFNKPKRNQLRSSAIPLKIDILVAAHNEEELIVHTLEKLSQSVEHFLKQNHFSAMTLPQVQIKLGLDHCTDQTETIVTRWAENKLLKVSLVKNPNSPGKWNMIQHLISESVAEWIILVDVGSVWKEGLLSAALPHFLNQDVLGIAPSYQPIRAGLVERWNWRLERFLKTIESGAGGPVSVHGATVMYRREPLHLTLWKLKRQFPEHSWLNDDVVIPLSLRVHWPKHRIHYLTSGRNETWVHDYGVKSDRGTEQKRRKRLVLGNLQWVRSFFPHSSEWNFSVRLIALRRVMRMFWAYWVLALVFGFTLVVIATQQPWAFAITMSLVSFAIWRLRSAFGACLRIPFYWFNTKERTEKIWN